MVDTGNVIKWIWNILTMGFIGTYIYWEWKEKGKVNNGKGRNRKRK